MKNKILLVLLLLGFVFVQSQEGKKNSINLSLGLGLSIPFDDVDVSGEGFYLQGEYVFSVFKWLDLRPYTGFVFTKTSNNDDNEEIYKVDTNAFLIGGKVRLKAPIPWVAPYLEGGIGASIGSFETYIINRDISRNGVITHFPFSLGLSIGPKHNIDVSFKYYIQPNVKQIIGAAALGISIPFQ